ncbi:MAG: nucleotidyltransferase domain-containing protein [Bacteroidales bacterium]
MKRLADMVDKIRLVKELKQKLIDNFGDNIVHVILFGSQATGTANEYSDYDVLIVLKNNYTWQFEKQIYNVCCDMEIDYEIYLDIIIISQAEIGTSIRGKQPVILNSLTNGIYA